MTITNTLIETKDVSTLPKGKKKAFENRQLDTGWGWAFGHLLPIVPLIYAIQRRTITPVLYNSIGAFSTAFIVGIIMGLTAPDTTEKEYENAAKAIGLITTPLLAKQGIDKARKYAATKLEEDNQ